MFHLVYENNLGAFLIFPMICHRSKFKKYFHTYSLHVPLRGWESYHWASKHQPLCLCPQVPRWGLEEIATWATVGSIPMCPKTPPCGYRSEASHSQSSEGTPLPEALTSLADGGVKMRAQYPLRATASSDEIWALLF